MSKMSIAVNSNVLKIICHKNVFYFTYWSFNNKCVLHKVIFKTQKNEVNSTYVLFILNSVLLWFNDSSK